MDGRGCGWGMGLKVVWALGVDAKTLDAGGMRFEIRYGLLDGAQGRTLEWGAGRAHGKRPLDGFL